MAAPHANGNRAQTRSVLQGMLSSWFETTMMLHQREPRCTETRHNNHRPPNLALKQLLNEDTHHACSWARNSHCSKYSLRSVLQYRRRALPDTRIVHITEGAILPAGTHPITLKWPKSMPNSPKHFGALTHEFLFPKPGHAINVCMVLRSHSPQA